MLPVLPTSRAETSRDFGSPSRARAEPSLPLEVNEPGSVGSVKCKRFTRSFIHSLVLITLAFNCLRRVIMYYSYYYFLLFSHHYCLFQLISLVLSLSAFLSYNSSRFVLLINSTVCFIICGWPNNLSIFNLPFPMSFIIFFLCSLYLRYSNR